MANSISWGHIWVQLFPGRAAVLRLYITSSMQSKSSLCAKCPNLKRAIHSSFYSQNSLSVHASPGFNQHVFGSQMKLNFEGNSDWVSGESNKVVTILLSFAIRESVDYWFCNQNFPFTSRLILSDSDSVCLAGSIWTDNSHLLQCLQLPTINKDENDEDGQDYDPWIVWDLSCYDLQHFM